MSDSKAVTGEAAVVPAPLSSLPTTIPAAKLNLALYKDGPLQKFEDAALQAQVERLASIMPAAKHFGVLGVANLDGAAVASVGRIGSDLTITMAVEKEWRKPGVKAEAQILYMPF